MEDNRKRHPRLEAATNAAFETLLDLLNADGGTPAGYDQPG